MKIVFFNGPPRSGKDYAASMIEGYPVKLAARLKTMTHQALGLVDSNGVPLPHDFFEDRKDVELREFRGATPRNAYIAMSEGFIKPLYGAGALGTWLADDITEMEDVWGHGLYLITDSGFREEAEEIVDRFGADNCTLVTLVRHGYSFKGDSRGYIDLVDLGVRRCVIENTGGPDFVDRLNKILL